MPATLDTILSSTRLAVDLRKQRVSESELEKEACRHAPRQFAKRMRALAPELNSKTRPAIIAELKMASPSKGILRDPLDVAYLASSFEAAGAAALSVLTEERHFLGSLGNLRLASNSCSLPILRKDFILDEYQLLEARAFGADAVLLIVAALDLSSLQTLAGRAHDLGLDVLSEAHDEREIDVCLELGAEMVGVNSRNLRTFEVSQDRLFNLVGRIPSHVVRIAESGIRGAEDIAELSAAGYDAFLIGEMLMRSPDPAAALSRLLQSGDKPCG